MNPVNQPWLYVQSTGQLFRPDGSFCADGYSGRGAYIDKPIAQNVKNEGPIPVGLYTLGTVDQEKGQFTIHLQPDPGNQMFGRSGFLVHGDNAEVNHTASEGCIIMPRLARIELARGGAIKVIDRPAVQEKIW
jgi:hypothetical protein